MINFYEFHYGNKQHKRLAEEGTLVLYLDNGVVKAGTLFLKEDEDSCFEECLIAPHETGSTIFKAEGTPLTPFKIRSKYDYM